MPNAMPTATAPTRAPLRLAYASAIALADGRPAAWQQILCAGTWQHPSYGTLAITPGDLAELKANFDAGVRAFVYADYDHGIASPKGDGNAIAAGEVKAVDLRGNGRELWALYEPTQRAADKIAAGEYRFTSADFETGYVDRRTGKPVGKVLRGFALTNRPFVEGMAPLTLSEIPALLDAAAPGAALLCAEYPNEAAASGVPMSVKTKLQLAESASDADVETAVDTLLSERQAAAPTTTALGEMRTALQLSDDAPAADVVARVRTLADENAALTKTKREGEADRLLDDAVRGGKLTPAEKPHWRTQLLHDVPAVADGAKTLLAQMPKRVPVGTRTADATSTQAKPSGEQLLDDTIKDLQKADPTLTYGAALVAAERQLTAAGTPPKTSPADDEAV
ncbi:peptidase [Gemmatimonadetes bacterium T265]|nr:peptidase [Gemmatimonadetes bacterium T265]